VSESPSAPEPADGRGFWITAAGVAELRGERVEPGPGEVLVETRFSGISRGTEALVWRGGVPKAERVRMRAPLQAGSFPFPVKYGYAAVGRVSRGPAALVGRDVFVLHPHQDVFAAPAEMAVPLPKGVPPGRAVLAANMETALNVAWDAGVLPCDRVAVVGAGVVGALVAWLCARLPGAEVTLVDVNPARAEVAAALGCGFAAPDAAPGDCDVVVHASATGAGLATALGAAGLESTVVESSWYGDRPPTVGLGGAFHSRRLRLVSSQVGLVPTGRRARWSNRRRLEAALRLLADPALDVLIDGETAFEDLPARYGAILDRPGTLCHRVRYD
jgi:threonine dehydrogenase-like Zn-dependent dehydrogenase